MTDMAAGSPLPRENAGGGAAPGRTPPMRFRFSGDGASYFGIWIVNIILTVVTIGIYSAWAKVRRLRYFYGNSSLGGDAFDYHAKPITILIGRIIAVAVIVAISILNNVFPLLSLGAFVAIGVALPWLFNRSMRFNARMTSWRNIRFDFEGSYWHAFLAILVMPIVAVISLGTLLPLATRVRQNYVLNRLRYGGAPFKAEIPIGKLYGGLLVTVLTFLGVALALGLLAYGVFISLQHVLLPALAELMDKYAGQVPEIPEPPEGVSPQLMIMLMIGINIGALLFGAAFVVASIVYRTIARNVSVGTTMLVGGGQLRSGLSPARMVWITLSNTLAIIFTLGLFYPWAKTRMWRYRTEQTGFVATGDLNAFVDTTAKAGDAFGSEYSDLADIDIGI